MRKSNLIQNLYNDKRLNFIIGDVRNFEAVCGFRWCNYVFHATALKQVPTCEFSIGSNKDKCNR